MRISVTLEQPRDAERLKTAVLRFAEMRCGESPAVSVLRIGDRVISEIDFKSPDAAAEFEAYWRIFRAERRSFQGLGEAW